MAERAHADAAGTDAKRATDVAALLRRALAVRDGEDCPVCGTPGVLDDAWAAHAAEQAAALEQQAAALTAAERELGPARRRVDGLLDATARAAPAAARGAGLAVPDEASVCEAPPAVLADLPAALDSPDAVLAAAAQLRALADRADAELSRRGAAWQALATHVSAWLDDAREVEQRAGTLKALKDAEKWVKGAAEDLRAERFAPISERAIANWRELRQGSSVDLHEITLKKVGRGGRADFDVRADGDAANALGVMSQGELLALSVSVFLPRAALDESPFRFAVIDDPVQAMDPAKVDGLARVLHRAARTRQIVVFTHDDRLPEAIRRLRLDATMLHVDRRAGSSVDVRESRAARSSATSTTRAATRSRAACRPRSRRASCPGSAATRSRPPRRTSSAAGRSRPAGRSTRPTSSWPRRARCARRSRWRCSATPAARATSATRSASATARTAASLVTELNRGAHGGARRVDAQAPARQHARLHPRT